MTTGTIIFILLAVAMVGFHLFGHSRRGARAAGGGHGAGGCCGGHGHGDHHEESAGREPETGSAEEDRDADSEQPPADDLVAPAPAKR